MIPTGEGPEEKGQAGRPRHRRLFYALWPDEAARAHLAAYLAALSPGEGRAMRPENLHLTLTFVGDCEEAQMSCLEAVGEALRGPPFVILLDRLGHFPAACVLWLGASQPPAELFALKAQLDGLLAGRCGMQAEARPFVPHVSLWRHVTQPRPWPEGVPPIVMRADRVDLLETLQGPEGVRYRPLHAWPLEDNPTSGG